MNLQEKLLSEREGNVAFPDVKSKCNSAFKPEGASTKFFTTPEINRPTEGAIASPSISSLRTRNAEEQTKERNGKSEENKNMTPDRRIELKAMGKVNANGVQKAGEAKMATKVDQINPSRPSNPFAKISNNQETPSLFSSLKKADLQGKL